MRLTTLNKALGENGSKPKAQIFRLRASRFNSLASRIGTTIVLVDDAGLQRWGALMKRSSAARSTALLQDGEHTAFADAGYSGVAKREEMNDMKVDWQSATRRCRIKKVNEKRPLRTIIDELERAKI